MQFVGEEEELQHRLLVEFQLGAELAVQELGQKVEGGETELELYDRQLALLALL